MMKRVVDDVGSSNKVYTFANIVSNMNNMYILIFLFIYTKYLYISFRNKCHSINIIQKYDINIIIKLI